MSRQDTSSLYVGMTREYDNLTVPFATAGTTLPVGSYEWTVRDDRATTRTAPSASTDRSAPISAATTTAIARRLRASVTSRSARRCCSSRNYTHNRVTLPGRPLYTSNVLNFRVSHSFSPDFYLKGFVQYNDDRKTASFNFLWWYHYKPGSDLYVVYNQGWDIDLPLTSREAAGASRTACARDRWP